MLFRDRKLKVDNIILNEFDVVIYIICIIWIAFDGEIIVCYDLDLYSLARLSVVVIIHEWVDYGYEIGFRDG